jgi:phospholipase C
VSALWGQPGLSRSGQVSEYYERCRSGTLPPLSFVDPSFAGEEQGTSGDEHPHGDVRTGQAFMSDVVNAFVESPQWKNGALFVVYDEWGGFFDHVASPRVPDNRSSRNLAEDFGRMGFRIPAVAVSPFVRRKHVDHGIYGFESILKMIRYRYGIAPLAKRDAYARNIARAFDFGSRPKLELPNLPDPQNVVSPPCGNGTSFLPRRETAERNESLRPWLDQIGFDFKPATYDAMFRQPSRVRSAARR